MVCSKEARDKIAASIGIHETRVTPPTWVNHLYSCTYEYPHGTIALSVKELVSARATTAVLRRARTIPRPGAAPVRPRPRRVPRHQWRRRGTQGLQSPPRRRPRHPRQLRSADATLRRRPEHHDRHHGLLERRLSQIICAAVVLFRHHEPRRRVPLPRGGSTNCVDASRRRDPLIALHGTRYWCRPVYPLDGTRDDASPQTAEAPSAHAPHERTRRVALDRVRRVLERIRITVTDRRARTQLRASPRPHAVRRELRHVSRLLGWRRTRSQVHRRQTPARLPRYRRANRFRRTRPRGHARLAQSPHRSTDPRRRPLRTRSPLQPALAGSKNRPDPLCCSFGVDEMIESDSGGLPRPVGAGGRRYALVGPDLRDPRLHVAMVVVSLQVLGQTVLHFDVSDRADPDRGRDVRGPRVGDHPVAPSSSGVAGERVAHRERRRVRVTGSRHPPRRLVEPAWWMDLRGGRCGVVAVEVSDSRERPSTVQPIELRPGLGLLDPREPPRRSTRVVVGTARHRARARIDRDPCGRPAPRVAGKDARA